MASIRGKNRASRDPSITNMVSDELMELVKDSCLVGRLCGSCEESEVE